MVSNYAYQERAVKGTPAFISSNYVISITLTAGAATVYPVATGAKVTQRICNDVIGGGGN